VSRRSQRILILGGVAIGLAIVALLTVIAYVLLSGNGGSESAVGRVTSSPTATPTSRPTPSPTAPRSTPSPAVGQASPVVTTVPGETPPSAVEQAPPPASPAPPTPTPPADCPGPPAIASFSANPSTITAGDSSTLSWGPVTNTAHAVIDQGIGEVAEWDSLVVAPATTTTYTLTATGCGGTTTQQATVIVNPAAQPAPSPTEQAPPTGGGSWGIVSPTPTEQPPPPGGGSWGILTTDLAVTGLNPDPNGEVWVTIANNGPETLSNISVELDCSGTTYFNADGTAVIATQPQTISVSLDAGWSQTFDTGISVDTTVAVYQLTCSIQVGFKDDVPGNDSYTGWIPP
jgi:hypothetical protein